MHGHVRNRYALDLLLKKLKFAPVVFLQGPRQTGKSFLVRELLPENIKHNYITLDKSTPRDYANRNPDTFIAQAMKDETLIIDEAQKAPPIFDSIKAHVDEIRTPGQFILLGSTEFSKMTLIRESLTGRATKLRIFPMTLSEVKSLQLNTSQSLINQKARIERKDLLLYLKNGGMPGLFNIRDPMEQKEAFEAWLKLTSERDAVNFKQFKIDSDLVYRILEAVAYLEDTSAGKIALHLKTDLRKIRTHVEVLKTLFVLNTVKPHPLSTGKEQYFFCDVGFLNVFNSTLEKKIKTWFVQEQLAQRSYNKESKSHLYFYRSSKGKVIDLIIEENEAPIMAIKVFAEESVSNKSLELLRAFKSKSKSDKIQLIALTGTQQRLKLDDVEILPWEIIS